MDNKFSVKFKTVGLEVKIPATNSTTVSELISSFFNAKKVDKEKNREKIDFELDSNNSKLDYDSKEKISQLGIVDNSIILVIDHGNVFTPPVERKRKPRGGGKKVIDSKEEIKEPETMLTVVRDMALFGYTESEKILKDKCDKDHEFITVEKALEMKNKDEHAFLLGLMGKYLKNLEMSVAVSLNEESEDKYSSDASHSTLQFLANGFITKRRINLIFEADQNFLTKANKDKTKNLKLNESLKDLLITEFPELEKETTVFTNFPIRDKFKATLITLKDQDIDITDNRLERAFKYQNGLSGKDIDYEEDNPLLEGIVLSKSFFLPQFDNKNDSKWGYNETRGKEQYIPPVGWWRYGVKCENLYGNNDDWLACDHRKGEWCIGYIGFRKQQEADKLVAKFEKDEDTRHNGRKVGIGVFAYQDPKDMEKDCEVIKYKNEEYLIGFMLRINPSAIRIPSKDKKYWVVDGTSETLRPCGILLKKIK